MSKITGIIPKQGFEIVRDLVGAILKVELDEQKILQGLTDEINVYNSRSTPFHQSEKIMINVSTDSANYDNEHVVGVTGRTSFFIDIYTSAKEKEDADGGLLSTILKDKYLGMIRFILQDHHYKTLGLAPGLIMNAKVEGFENFEPSNNQDASFVKMARLSYSVKLYENQSVWNGIEISTIFTDVKLDLTERGYKYELIN